MSEDSTSWTSGALQTEIEGLIKKLFYSWIKTLSEFHQTFKQNIVDDD